MKPSLQVRLSQHLALTPQLQQSIRLLQLSTLELQQEIEQMLEANPFLEPDEDSDAPLADGGVERTRAAERNDEGAGDAAESGDGADGGADDLNAGEFGTTEREDWENGTERDDFDGIAEMPGGSAGPGEDDDGQSGVERAGGAFSLTDHLHRQALELRLSPEDAAALRALIESLDDDGYLDGSLDEIAERLADAIGLHAHEAREDVRARLGCALHWLQHLDPPGVGARDLAECVCLQLRQQPECEARAVALAIAAEHLDLLAKRDLKRLMSLTGADEDLVREAQELIRHCEPKPGRPFADAEANIIVPDVIVQRSGRGLKVVLNPDVMPKLRINEIYARAMRGQRNGSGAALAGRLQEARWFVRNIQQRFDTILRVSAAIVDRQRAFFAHGAIAMKPLVLREIADELGLHESTISRVTTAKYMATPVGTFELKYFFGSGLATETGGAASSTAVRALIQQFVTAEDAAKPLSDNQIAQMLEEQGIQCARRTVAKYREALKIAPASQRKAM